MKRKEKVPPDSKRKLELWALPKKSKVSFDEALISLGVQIKV